MTKYFLIALLLTTQAMAQTHSFYFKKHEDGWKSAFGPDRKYYITTETSDGFEVDISTYPTIRGVDTDNCGVRYGSDNLKDFGVKFKMTCDSNKFTVYIYQGLDKKPVDPSDMEVGTYFFAVVHENTAEGGASKKSSVTLDKKSTPIKEREPSGNNPKL